MKPLRIFKFRQALVRSGALLAMSGPQTKVIYCLELYADNDTLELYPSIQTITSQCWPGHPERVREALKLFEQLGIIETLEIGGGFRHPTRRRLLVLTVPPAPIFKKNCFRSKGGLRQKMFEILVDYRDHSGDKNGSYRDHSGVNSRQKRGDHSGVNRDHSGVNRDHSGVATGTTVVPRTTNRTTNLTTQRTKRKKRYPIKQDPEWPLDGEDRVREPLD
jgi:hypothetical protein